MAAGDESRYQPTDEALRKERPRAGGATVDEIAQAREAFRFLESEIPSRERGRREESQERVENRQSTDAADKQRRQVDRGCQRRRRRGRKASGEKKENECRESGS